MNDFGSTSNQAGAADLMGAILSDGLMAGLIGGIVGSILPIFGLFTKKSSMVSLGFLVSIFLYLGIGILTGYLFYSRKIGYRWGAAAAAILAGLVTGFMAGGVMGLAFTQFPSFGVESPWIMWGCSSGLGAAFCAALTAWIPGFFIKFDNTDAGQQAAAAGTESFFERRMKTRFVVALVSFILFIVIYICQAIVR